MIAFIRFVCSGHDKPHSTSCVYYFIYILHAALQWLRQIITLVRHKKPGSNDYVKTLTSLSFWLHHSPELLGASQTTPMQPRHYPLNIDQILSSQKSEKTPHISQVSQAVGYQLWVLSYFKETDNVVTVYIWAWFTDLTNTFTEAGIILGMGSANESRHYILTPALIGRVHTLVSLIVKRVWLLTQWKKIPDVLLFVAINIV